MSLDDKLKKAAIENLKRVNINMLNTYARTNGSTLNFLYNRGTIDAYSIEEALEHAVFNQARQDIRLMENHEDYTLYIDDLGRPECIAYALGKNKLSKREIEKINFNHGRTVETFSQKYGNLLSILRNELLNPKHPKLS